jgi:hypothetical protein
MACWGIVRRDDHSCHTSNEAPNLDLLGSAHYARVALRGRVPVAGSVGAAPVHSGGSAAVRFAATGHLALASGTAAVASEIGGAAFASASACDSSAVALKTG